jgi:hypothetical protein
VRRWRVAVTGGVSGKRRNLQGGVTRWHAGVAARKRRSQAARQPAAAAGGCKLSSQELRKPNNQPG